MGFSIPIYTGYYHNTHLGHGLSTGDIAGVVVRHAVAENCIKDDRLPIRERFDIDGGEDVCIAGNRPLVGPSRCRNEMGIGKAVVGDGRSIQRKQGGQVATFLSRRK